MIHIVPIGFHSKHLYPPIKLYGAEKVILIVSEFRTKEKEEKINDALEQSKKILDLLSIPYKIIKIKEEFDLNKRVNLFTKLIKKYKNIIINLTGGPKFDALALYLAALKNIEHVKDIIYIREDLNEPISFPKIILSKTLTKFEITILKKINEKKQISAKQLAKSLNRSFPQILKYTKKLEKKGLIETEKKENKKIIKTKTIII